MLKQLFSIEEKKVSALIVGFFLALAVFLGLAVMATLTKHQCPEFIYEQLSNALGFIIMGVVGGGAVSVGQELLTKWQDVKGKVSTTNKRAKKASAASDNEGDI